MTDDFFQAEFGLTKRQATVLLLYWDSCPLYVVEANAKSSIDELLAMGILRQDAPGRFPEPTQRGISLVKRLEAYMKVYFALEGTNYEHGVVELRDWQPAGGCCIYGRAGNELGG
jgi:hypothetical protein